MDNKIRIIIDQAIPFIEGVLEPYADVRYMEGREISHEDAMNADALVIRTRTRCDASLLEGTPVKFIATATIGMDHIDLPYCNKKGVVVRNSAGCNAGGVMNYVFSALYGVAARKSIRLEAGDRGSRQRGPQGGFRGRLSRVQSSEERSATHERGGNGRFLHPGLSFVER